MTAERRNVWIVALAALAVVAFIASEVAFHLVLHAALREAA